MWHIITSESFDSCIFKPGLYLHSVLWGRNDEQVQNVLEIFQSMASAGCSRPTASTRQSCVRFTCSFSCWHYRRKSGCQINLKLIFAHYAWARLTLRCEDTAGYFFWPHVPKNEASALILDLGFPFIDPSSPAGSVPHMCNSQRWEVFCVYTFVCWSVGFSAQNYSTFSKNNSWI